MDELDDILEHYGVKGMKWGKRKARVPVVTKVSVQATPGRKVKTSGGTGQKAHPDAVTAAISRQKANKSSVDSLSNQELQALVKRMNLEQQYSQLKINRQSPAKKFVMSLIGDVGKQQSRSVANQYASQQVAKLFAKKAAGA